MGINEKNERIVTLLEGKGLTKHTRKKYTIVRPRITYVVETIYFTKRYKKSMNTAVPNPEKIIGPKRTQVE